MAFDEVRLPLKVGYGAGGGPSFLTEVVTIDNGFERRNQVWSQARRKYDARTGVRSLEDAAVLVAFFQARAGRARGFRLKDWADYSSAGDGVSAPTAVDQLLAIGDGVTKNFQLVKTYRSGGVSYARRVTKPVGGSVMIAVDGVVAMTGWSVVETTGTVMFSVAPVAGARVTAGFLFDVPVRFDTDYLDLTAREPHLYEGKVPLIEIRV